MDLYDILLLKAIVKASGGTADDATIQEIIRELETKVDYTEMETYVTQQVIDLPTISEGELEKLLI